MGRRVSRPLALRKILVWRGTCVQTVSLLNQTVARACIAWISPSLGGRIRSVRNATADKRRRC